MIAVARHPARHAARLAWVWLVLIPIASAQRGEPPHFTDVAGQSGLRFVHSFGAAHLESVLMTTGRAWPAVTWTETA